MTPDSWTTLAFYIMAVGMVGMALAVVGLPRIVHSALALVAFFVGMVSALMGRFVAAGLVILGNMSLHGVLSPVHGLGDKLRIAIDSGVRRVILPSVNSRDLADLPGELLEKLQIDFYGDPTKAAYKAIAVGE